MVYGKERGETREEIASARRGSGLLSPLCYLLSTLLMG
jgi:hypothetical protein